MAFNSHDFHQVHRLVNRDDDYGDKALFKQFGSDEIKKGNTFSSNWFSTYREEFDGYDVPFVDEAFEIELESYSDGEPIRLEIP